MFPFRLPSTHRNQSFNIFKYTRTGSGSYKRPVAVSSKSPAFHPTGCVLPVEMHLHSFIFSVTALVVGAVSVHASSLHDSSELRTRQLAFRSQILNDTNLRYVANSGICETTPGVTQYSGYIDVGTNMSMVSTIWCTKAGADASMTVVLVLRGSQLARDCPVHALVRVSQEVLTRG